MKKYSKFITFLSLVSYSLMGISQGNDDYLLRKINLRALSTIDEYRRNSQVFDRKDFDKFSAVFNNNQQTLIANDVLADNQINQQLTVFQYPQVLSNYFDKYEYQTKISPLYLSPVRFDNNGFSGTINVYVEKIISGKTKFNTMYIDTLIYNFQIIFDSLYHKNFYIVNISSLEERGKYCIVEAQVRSLFTRYLMKNENVVFKKDTLLLNENAQVFLKDIKEDFMLKPVNQKLLGSPVVQFEDIGTAKNNRIDKNIAKIKFRLPFLSFAANFGISPNSFPIVKNKQPDLNIVTNSNKLNYSATFLTGLIFFQKRTYSFSLFLGIKYNSNNYILSLNRNTITYPETDPDEWNYLRTNTIKDIIENHKLEFLSFPLRLQTDISVFEKHYLNLSISALYYRSLFANFQTNATGQYSGYYDDLFGITIAENGIYDFGTFNLSNIGELNFKKNFYGYNASVGFLYSLSRRCFINFALDYSFTDISIFDYNKKELSKDYSEIYSLTNLSDKFYFNIFEFNLGLLIKI